MKWAWSGVASFFIGVGEIVDAVEVVARGRRSGGLCGSRSRDPGEEAVNGIDRSLRPPLDPGLGRADEAPPGDTSPPTTFDSSNARSRRQKAGPSARSTILPRMLGRRRSGPDSHRRTDEGAETSSEGARQACERRRRCVRTAGQAPGATDEGLSRMFASMTDQEVVSAGRREPHSAIGAHRRTAIPPTRCVR